MQGENMAEITHDKEVNCGDCKFYGTESAFTQSADGSESIKKSRYNVNEVKI